MELSFQVNVAKENTKHSLTGFYVPVIAKLLPVAGIEISVGNMKVHEVMEVVNWQDVHNDAEALASFHFQNFKLIKE